MRAALEAGSPDETWRQIREVGARVGARLRGADPADVRGTVYCVLAHDLWKILCAQEGESLRLPGEAVLSSFDTSY